MVNAPLVASHGCPRPDSLGPATACSAPSTCQGDAAQHYERTLQAALKRAEQTDAVWIFGYASLIWRPEFEAEEVRQAQVTGWHRALRMQSRINRGSVDQPGLVFALLNGGRCCGQVYRLSRAQAPTELPRLWSREMPMAAYDPRWLRCQTVQGDVQALAFTLPRSHPSHTGPMDDPSLLHVLRHARGRYGSTLDYVLQTARALRGVGIRDAAIERLVRLAQSDGLLDADESLRPNALLAKAAATHASATCDPRDDAQRTSSYDALRSAANPA
jgi:glutathione-specific gamma-glutamylcyclotransferase